MKRWITQDIIALVKRTIAEPSVAVIPVEAGGDVDGQGVAFTMPGSQDTITVRPFKTNGYYKDSDGDRSNIDAELVELRDLSSDSGGGVTSRHEATAIAGARLRIALENAGWQVVRQLKDYF